MGDDVLGDLLEPGFSADELGKLCPLAFGLFAAGFVFFVFDDFFDLLVQLGDRGLVEVEFGEAALVINWDGGLVIDGILDIIDADIIAEDAAGVFVGLGDRGASEADERGMGQGVAQVFGVAVDVASGFGVEFGLESVLAAVGFVGDDDNVGPIAQNWVTGFVGEEGEFLDGGEDDAAGLAFGEFLAEGFAAVGLFRGLFEQGLGAAKLLVELAVEVVAIGDDDEGGVVHGGLLEQFSGVAAHGDAFAGALGVPEDACFAGAGDDFFAIGGTGFVGFAVGRFGSGNLGDADGFTDTVELVVSGDFFD